MEMLYRYRSGQTNPRAYEYPNGMAQPYNSYSVDKLSEEMVKRLNHDHDENLADAWVRIANEVFTPGRKLMLEGKLGSKPENGIQKIGLFEVKEMQAWPPSTYTLYKSAIAHVKLFKRQGAELVEGETPETVFLLTVSLLVHKSDAPPIYDGGPQCYTLTGEGPYSSSGMAKPYKHGAYYANLWVNDIDIAKVCLGFSESWSTVKKKVPVINALNRWYTDAVETSYAPGGLSHNALLDTYRDGFDGRRQQLEEQLEEQRRKRQRN